MPEQLYPRPRRKWGRLHRWRVDYNLAYDGGRAYWSGYYYTKTLARIATFWNVRISSWGGTAVLFDQNKGE